MFPNIRLMGKNQLNIYVLYTIMLEINHKENDIIDWNQEAFILMYKFSALKTI